MLTSMSSQALAVPLFGSAWKGRQHDRQQTLVCVKVAAMSASVSDAGPLVNGKWQSIEDACTAHVAPLHEVHV